MADNYDGQHPENLKSMLRARDAELRDLKRSHDDQSRNWSSALDGQQEQIRQLEEELMDERAMRKTWELAHSQLALNMVKTVAGLMHPAPIVLKPRVALENIRTLIVEIDFADQAAEAIGRLLTAAGVEVIESPKKETK